MSEQSVLFAWPKAFGGSPNFTPFQDHEREVEWQRTQHALGRPVDVNALFGIIETIDAGYAEELDEKRGELDEVQRHARDMVDAIEQAVDDLNRKVRTRLSEEIIGRLNRIDRHDVAALVKEIIGTIETIQGDLRRAKV